MKILIIAFLVLVHFAHSEEAYILQKYQNGKFLTLKEKNVQTLTMPGSLFKLLTASYLIDYRRDQINKSIFCPGKKIYRKKCWNNLGHGWIDLVGALAHSCNFYFLELTQGMLIENYVTYLKKEFAFPADVSSFSQNAFLGENLSRPLTIKEIAEILNHFYLKINQEEKYLPIVKGMNQATKGTLMPLISNFEKASSLKIIGGKTGSSNWEKPISGMVYLLLKNSLEENFTLLFYHRGTMGANIPVRKIIPVLKVIKP